MIIIYKKSDLSIIRFATHAGKFTGKLQTHVNIDVDVSLYGYLQILNTATARAIRNDRSPLITNVITPSITLSSQKVYNTQITNHTA